MSTLSQTTIEQMTRQIAELQQQLRELNHRLETAEKRTLLSKDVLTLEEAALYLGMKKSNLYKMTHRMEIPFYKPQGKMNYFERTDLDAWMRRGRSMSRDEIDAQAQARIGEMNARTDRTA